MTGPYPLGEPSSTPALALRLILPEGALLVWFVFVGRVARLVRRHGDLLRRDLAGDDRDVDLFVVLAVDQDRGAGLELAAEDEIGERVLDEALDRAAQRPGSHRRVVALVDEQLLRAVGQLDRGVVLAHLV